MNSTKTRTALTTLFATLALALAAVAPAASQAQWHHLMVGGHMVTHENFTEGGVSPCTRIEKELGKAEGAVGDYKEKVEKHDAGEEAAKEGQQQAEGEVVRTSGEAFEYGCDTTAAAKSSHPQGHGTHAGSGLRARQTSSQGH
jgi:hypothetical protein